MTASSGKETVHTFLDDIKYQVVKENHKRTGFISSDHQIVSKSQKVLQNIEKREKLASADLKRQQEALAKRLTKLKVKQEELGIPPKKAPGRVVSRRNSAPVDGSSASSNASCSPTREQYLTGSRNSIDKSGKGSPDSIGEWQISSPSYVRQNFRETRRMSHEIQAETAKMALERVNTIVAGSKRRATIAEGASPFDSLLSSGNINRLNEIASRSKSIDEEC